MKKRTPRLGAGFKSLTKSAALPTMGDALRSAPQCPSLVDIEALAPRDVFFSDAHVAGKNRINFIRACGRGVRFN